MLDSNLFISQLNKYAAILNEINPNCPLKQWSLLSLENNADDDKLIEQYKWEFFLFLFKSQFEFNDFISTFDVSVDFLLQFIRIPFVWDNISSIKFFDEQLEEILNSKYVNYDNFLMYNVILLNYKYEEFLIKNIESVNWNRVQFGKLSDDFFNMIIEKHSDKFSDDDWRAVFLHRKVSEEFIEQHIDKVIWHDISQYQKLSEAFIEKYADKVDWFYISQYQKFSEQFVKKHLGVLLPNCLHNNYYSEDFLKYLLDKQPKWAEYICSNQCLSEDFIINNIPNETRLVNAILLDQEISKRILLHYKNEYNIDTHLKPIKHLIMSKEEIEEHIQDLPVNSVLIKNISEEFVYKLIELDNSITITSRFADLSEDFIEKNQQNINWYDVSKFQKLSESFIRRYADKLDWNQISTYQQLSEDFIIEFKTRVNWYNIARYQKLSQKFIERFSIRISNDNMRYKTKKEKLAILKKHCGNLYEIVNDEYIVAYKAVHKDNSSIYKTNMVYNVGETYTESHCDYNNNCINSFGLSAWTKEGALQYHNKGKILTIHIDIDDICAIVYFDQKLRCSKFKVISEVDAASLIFH